MHLLLQSFEEKEYVDPLFGIACCKEAANPENSPFSGQPAIVSKDFPSSL